MTAGLYYSHPACLRHDPRQLAPGHPDTPERLLAIERALASRPWPEWERREAASATAAQLELIHSPAHVRSIAELCAAGGGAIDLDTYAGAESFTAAEHAAGAACAMVSALLAGEAEVGFCAVRPSGHHAEPDRAMGFCLFNNVAIAAELAIRELGVERVLILDWDVHHGNGTAEAFRTRADVLFVSIHQMPLYPGSGPASDVGSGAGEGYTLNLPVAQAFTPGLLLVSAGFDAHAQDPLAGCLLQSGSFARIALLLRDLARELHIPLGAVLEGGYAPQALGSSVLETLAALGGDAAPVRGAPLLPAAERALEEARRYWPL